MKDPIERFAQIDEVVRNSCESSDFREKFISDPKATLESVGVEFPEGQEVMVITIEPERPPPLIIHLPPLGAETMQTDTLQESVMASQMAQQCEGKF